MSVSNVIPVLQDRGPYILTASVIMMVFATALVLMRLVSKWGITKRVNADDWLCVLAWVFIVTMAAMLMVATRTTGLGLPDQEIEKSHRVALGHYVYVFTVLYNPALMATKTAILLLYIRMAEAHPFLRYSSMVIMAIVNLAGAVLTFLNLFPCRPVAATWGSRDHAKCIDVIQLYLSAAPINVLTDLAILLVPLPILTSLRMEFRQKIVLVMTFILGGLVSVFDIIRIAYLQSSLQQDLLSSTGVSDQPTRKNYELSFSLLWTLVEVSVGLMCACLLVLKPLVMRVLPGLLTRKRMEEWTRRTSENTASGGPPPVDEYALANISKSPKWPALDVLVALPELPSHEIDAPTRKINQTENQQAVNDSVDFFDMLANGPGKSAVDHVTSPTLDMSDKSPLPRLDGGKAPNQAFFDFVKIDKNKPLTELTAKEAWWPVLLVSMLFFLLGFAYGLVGTLTGKIQSLLEYTPSQAIALSSAYWIAYAIGPPTIGYYTLSHGFKTTFVTGLCIFATGVMSFWPSSVLKSYPGFYISNFIIALGLSVCEVAANPYVALAGPGEWSEARLNFAQGVQGLGGLFSPIIAEKALFHDITGKTLFDVQWCYLAVALFVIALAVVFFYVPLSEASAADLDDIAQRRIDAAQLNPDSRIRHYVLYAGVVAMAIYVGAQESAAYFWTPTIQAIKPTADPFWFQTIARATFAFGRFLGSFLCWIGIPPRIVLTLYILGAFLTSLLTMVLPPGNGPLSTQVLLLFFESAIFPTLFALTMRNAGKHTRLTSTLLVSMISGGGVFPSIVYAVNKTHLDQPRYGLRVTVGLYAISFVYGLSLSGTRDIRRWLDPEWSRPPNHDDFEPVRDDAGLQVQE